jgi:hypothetical protein
VFVKKYLHLMLQHTLLIFCMTCGGQGVSPPEESLFDDRSCLPQGQLPPQTQEWLDDEAFVQSRDEFRRILIEERGLSTLLKTTLHLVDNLPSNLASEYKKWREELQAQPPTVESLETSQDVFEIVMNYIIGNEKKQAHPELLITLSEIMRTSGQQCDVVDFVKLISQLMRLQITFDGEQRRWLSLFIEAVNQLISESNFSASAASIQLGERSEEIVEGDEIYIGSVAFRVLNRWVLSQLSSEFFDAADLRRVLDDVVLDFFPEDAKLQAHISHLWNVMLFVTENKVMMPSLQRAASCMLTRDTEGVLSDFIFYIAVEHPDVLSQNYENSLNRIGDTVNERILQILPPLLDILASQKTLLYDSVSVIRALLTSSANIEMMKALKGIVDYQVVQEWLLIIDDVGEQCRQSFN